MLTTKTPSFAFAGSCTLSEYFPSSFPGESEGVCLYRRWFVCLSLCLTVTTITLKCGRICTKFYGKVS